MHRFLIEFDVPPHPPPPFCLPIPELKEALLSLPWGVTGNDLGDCLAMIADYLVLDELPPTRRVQVDVDVSTVRPNASGIGVPVWRGIWLPPYNRQMSGNWPHRWSIWGAHDWKLVPAEPPPGSD